MREKRNNNNNKTNKVRVFFWEGCPSWNLALERVKKAIDEISSQKGKKFELEVIEVKTDIEAEKLRFPGSPTITVNDKDIDEEGSRQNPGGLTCRVYFIDGKYLPLPPYEFIKEMIDKLSV